MKHITKKILVAVMAAMAPVTVFAQTADGLLSNATSTVKTAGNNVANLVSALIGLVGVIMLGWNFAKRAKGDQQSNDSLLNWGSALIIAAIFLQVIKSVYF